MFVIILLFLMYQTLNFNHYLGFYTSKISNERSNYLLPPKVMPSKFSLPEDLPQSFFMRGSLLSEFKCSLFQGLLSFPRLIVFHDLIIPPPFKQIKSPHKISLPRTAVEERDG
jgi:hypothetical protein